MSPSPPSITLAVSSCLCGEPVRYDGRTKHNRLVTEHLSRLFNLLPICPEVAIGLPVPRPAVELVMLRGVVHARGVADPSLDISHSLIRLAESLDQEMAGVSGYIWKGRSPSCGLGSTPVRGLTGGSRRGDGLFAASLSQRHPLLPMIEDQALSLPSARSHFIEQVLFYHRCHTLIQQPATLGQLRTLFADYRLRLLSHHPGATRKLERSLSSLRGRVSRARQQAYLSEITAILRRPTTRQGHLEVLRGVLQKINTAPDSWEEGRLKEAVGYFTTGERTLSEVKGLLRHYLQRDVPGKYDQDSYLHPDPIEIALQE